MNSCFLGSVTVKRKKMIESRSCCLTMEERLMFGSLWRKPLQKDKKLKKTQRERKYMEEDPE